MKPNSLPQLVSIVMPVFNQARYLPHSIRSVLAESRLEIELILVDDGSTDDIDEALATAGGDPRVKVIRQENAGLSRALNRGFAAARGGFLTWTSADNEFLPGALLQLADYLRRNPACGLVYANVQLIDDQGNLLQGSSYRTPDQTAADSSVLHLPAASSSLYLLNDNFINSCFMFRRQLLKIAGEHDPRKNGFEDYDFWLRGQLGFSFSHIDRDEPLYRYRIHPESMTSVMRNAGLSEQQSSTVLRAAKRHEELPTYQPKLTSTDRIPQNVWRLMAATMDAKAEADGEISPEFVETALAHSSHARYFEADFMGALRVRVPGTESAKEALFLPPMRIPRLFERARDSSLGAVTPHVGANGVALIFCPEQGEWALNQTVELAQSATTVTWVLFCRTASQRTFADKVNLRLNSNSHLRIIDVSNEAAWDWEPPRAEHYGQEPWQERSLLYALSGVDAIVSLRENLTSSGHLLELRCEAAIAAAAGKPIAAVCRGQLGEARNLSELQTLVFDMPHLAVISPVSETALVSHLKSAPLVASLEQWLQMQTVSALRKQLKALLLSSDSRWSSAT